MASRDRERGKLAQTLGGGVTESGGGALGEDPLCSLQKRQLRPVCLAGSGGRSNAQFGGEVVPFQKGTGDDPHSFSNIIGRVNP